jgi:hypothetical protein
VTDSSLPVATGSQLGSAIGGLPPLSTNLSAAGAVVAPAPLSLTSTLPPTQASLMISSDPNADPIGGRSDSGVVPANLPEPGALALFAIVLFTSAMKIALRRGGRRGSFF